MKAKLKVDKQWLELEKVSLSKMKKDYEDWTAKTLQKAKDAQDMRQLRELFYQLGDRWEFDQATGAWLSSGEPLDAVGLIVRIPGFQPNKERFVVYLVMAYSKGLTDQFDHLGDKERIIIERDTESGDMYCWSTTGHGAMDLVPTDLTMYESYEDALEACFLVAQPGDHALRIQVPRSSGSPWVLAHRLWEIATGDREYTAKGISVLSSTDIEEVIEYNFYSYAKSVIELERVWKEFSSGVVEQATELIKDEIPEDIEKKDKSTLRLIEGLLHILWFKPPAHQLEPARRVYETLTSESNPTDKHQRLTPLVNEVIVTLNDLIERAKYLKWKSVIDKKDFDKSDVFQGLELTRMAKEAFAVALDDILREHTLAYVGYPERATWIGKAMRIAFGLVVLPARLVASFVEAVKRRFIKKKPEAKEPESEEPDSSVAEEKEAVTEETFDTESPS
jgi:hypothetical protein